MLAEIFMLRLESAARVAAQEGTQVFAANGSGTEDLERGAFSEYRAPGDLEGFAQLREHLEAHPPAAASPRAPVQSIRRMVAGPSCRPR
jgi:hypothetical protein